MSMKLDDLKTKEEVNEVKTPTKKTAKKSTSKKSTTDEPEIDFNSAVDVVSEEDLEKIIGKENLKNFIENYNKKEESEDNTTNDENVDDFEELDELEDESESSEELDDFEEFDDEEDETREELSETNEEIDSEEIDEFEELDDEEVEEEFEVFDPSDLKIATKVITKNSKFSSDLLSSTSYVISNYNHRIKPFSGLDMKAINSKMAQYEDGEIELKDLILEILTRFHSKIENTKLSFDEWCRIIKNRDLVDIYAAIYKSVINNEDRIPITCPNCKKPSVVGIDGSFVDNYMMFKNEEEKEKFLTSLSEAIDIKDRLPDYEKGSIIKINEKYAIELVSPNLYDELLLTTLMLNEARRARENNEPSRLEKYKDCIDYLNCIKNLYTIKEDGTFERLEISFPITNKNDRKKADMRKLKYKLITVNKILSTFSVDELNKFTKYIEKFLKNEEEETKIEYKYVLPKIQCPRCGNIVSEEHKDYESTESISMINLLLVKAR